jgi:tetratricopeptide (TPR) repeat protein
VTRFVGRESEIETLRQAGARVEQHHGQIVGVLGEPGVGKSRLLHETVGDLRRWLVLSAGCVPYGRNASYFPFIELLKSWGRIQDTETASEVRDAVRKCVPPAAGDPDTIVPPLLDLLGVLPAEDAFRRIEPVQRRHHIHDSLKRVFLTASAAQPLCLVVEDLHWVDAESQAVLDLLVESIPASRVLILANYRPEYRHGWGSKTYFRQLQLHPLAGHSAADLARELLGTDPSLEGLSPLLIQRTDGNPFFLEESVRSLVEAGALSGQRGAYRLVTDHPVVDVPATVQAILSARIDHLPPEEKTLLQTAAIIGKEFPFALLQAIAGLTESTLRERLAALQGAEFLYETRFFPDLEYTFKHALTQEVAYGSLAQERRRALHGGIVDALEKLHADRPDEQVERLAHHAQQGEMWEQAVTYLRRAGLKALARSAGREAVSCFEQALEALGHRPRSRQTQELAIDLRFDLKTSLFPLGAFERMVDSLREAEGLARRLDDRRRLGQVYIHLCHTIGLAGHSTEAVAFGQNARAIAESLGDVALQVTANLFLGGAYLRAGDYRRAEDLVLRVLELTEGKPVSSAVTGRSYLTWICAGRGDFKQGIAHGQEGLRLAEALNNPVGLANMCSYLGHLQLARGEFERAVGLFARGLALTREWSLPYFSAGHSGGLGSAHAFLGRTAEGISLMEQAVSAFEAMGVRFAQSLFLVLLGEGYVLADRLADALEISARGLTVAREHGHRDVEARALRLLGEVSARRDPPERAEGHYRDALALAEELEMRPLAAHCHLGLGKLYRRIGDSEQAQERLAVAAAMYREMDMRFWLEKAEAEIGAADVG